MIAMTDIGKTTKNFTGSTTHTPQAFGRTNTIIAKTQIARRRR